ncbi:MAG: small multi-drug export protein [Bacillota bacterium]
MPILEFKAGIPLGIAKGMTPFWATVVGILGTLVQVPFNLLFLRLLINLAERYRSARRVLVWSRMRARKHRQLVRRWGVLGVALIVGIPVPGTGLFTGTVAGALIGLDTRSLVIGLVAGTVAAAVLVALATTGLVHLFW